MRKIGSAINAEPLHFFAAVLHGVWTNGQPGAVEVRNQTLLVTHDLERRLRVRFGHVVQQRPRPANRTFNLPECITSVKTFFLTKTPRNGRVLFSIFRTAVSLI